MKIGFISLGCTKNLVDTEMTIGLFKEHNYEIVNNVKEAEVIIINTCGFIESAKQEAIDTMLEMAEYKQTGKCKYLIAMGCLIERYQKELEKLIPEVDLFISIKEYDKLWEKIENLINKENKNVQIAELDYLERVVTTGSTTTYLKIAEGCSNKCTYCAIPNIRGPYISRPFEEIIEEAKSLASKGYKEIIVIAQDTTKYGIDIYGEPKLAELLEELVKIDDIKWIRFLYSYPEGITDKLIEVVKNNDKICKYFDIPIQHISNKILKTMNRRTSKEYIENLISKIRKEIPEVVLRTSLIVGFPGETQEDFDELYEFVNKTKFDRLGTFMYSKEENTPASRLPNQIHHSTKRARYNKIMKDQKEIANEILKNKIGKRYTVLIEDISFDNKYFIGRTMFDIPEEDGLVYIKNNGNLNKEEILNKFIECDIIDINEYDLIGKII